VPLIEDDPHASIANNLTVQLRHNVKGVIVLSELTVENTPGPGDGKALPLYNLHAGDIPHLHGPEH
jgi:hypothetical protein